MADPVVKSAAAAPPPRAKVLLAFAAVYLVWGSTYIAIRYAVETIPPLVMAGARNATAGLMLYAWARTKGGSPRPSRADWLSTALIGVLMLTGGNGGVSWAETRVASGLVAVVVATVPLWIVVLSGRRPGLFVITGIALGLAGIVILVGPSHFAGAGRIDVAGTVVVLLGSLSWSIGSLLARRLHLPGSPHTATGMEMFLGGIGLLAAGFATGEFHGWDPAAITLRSALSVVYLVFMGSLVGFSAYVWLLRHVPPARVATYAFVNPVVAVLLGWAVAGEALSARTLLATGVIVAGVAFIVTHPEPRT